MYMHTNVRRGVALLDNDRGTEWVTKIDLDRLSITSARRCVLGQLYGDYGWGMKQVGLYGDSSAIHHGFQIRWVGFLPLLVLQDKLLTRAWKREITLLKMEHGRSRPDLVEQREMAKESRIRRRHVVHQDDYALAGR